MKCSRIVDRLPLYVGNDLDEARALEVERHLATCEACAAERDACEASRQSLFALKGETPPPAPDLWPGVRLRLGPPPRRRRRFPLPLRAAAALLAAAAGTWAVVSAVPGGAVSESEAPPPIVTEGVLPADGPVRDEFMLAEVGHADGAAAGDLPSVTLALPERSGWDEF
jgi:anti-sigma factor RsiW